ncbi:MAG: hypothetical protein IPM07_10280 [Anaerolineales bacterium]|nr:hypothetical protein [Anaerolineales bacterium]
MARPDLAKWGSTLADFAPVIVRQSIHGRGTIPGVVTDCVRYTRMPRSGRAAMKHDDNTVLKWVHTYNSLG